MRRSAKRGDRPVAEANARASSKPVTPRKPRAAKPAAKTARATPGAGPRATAKRAATKPAAPPRAAAKPTPRAAAKPTPRAGAQDSPRATAGPTPSAERARPRDTPRRKVPAAGYAAADGRAGEPSTSAGAELVRTTIQAAAELAQIGLTVGRQTLQSMLDRLPKP